MLLVALLPVGCATLPDATRLATMPAPHASLPLEAAVATDGRARFRSIFCSVLARTATTDATRDCNDWLWLLPDEPVVAPQPEPPPPRRLQAYLVTGAFSECLGEEARPFRQAAAALSSRGYRIATIDVSGRSGTEFNAAQIKAALAAEPPPADTRVLLIGYSKGANDILEFLVRYPESASQVAAVVSVAGPVYGTPLADLARGTYKAVVDGVMRGKCGPGDGEVVDSLSPTVRTAWMADHPLPPEPRYFSLASFTTRDRVAVALLPTWKWLVRREPRSDGQLMARDMLIPGATLLGYPWTDHWSVALDVETLHPRLGARRDPVPYPREALLEATLLQVGESLAAAARRAGVQVNAAAVPPPLPQLTARCDAPVYASDQQVCSDPGLRQLDQRLATLLVEVGAAADNLPEAQADWFQRRSLCTFSERQSECLQAAYEERIGLLEALRVPPQQIPRR
jgi:dienelactone hydrolase